MVYDPSAAGLSAPSPVAAPVSLDADITPPRGVYVGGAGHLVVRMLDQNQAPIDVTFQNVQAGTIYPIQPLRIFSATTATGLIALY